MKARELIARCLKARIISWLNSTRVGAIIPTVEGHGVIIAVYDNGRYVEPETLRVPDSPAEMWGPDGPIYRSQPPETPPETPDTEQEEGNDGT